MLTVLTISILLLRQASEHFVGEVVTNSSCILGVDVAGVGVGDVLAAGTHGAGAAADADVSDDKVDEVAGTALTSWMMQYVEHLAGVVVKTSSSATLPGRLVLLWMSALQSRARKRACRWWGGAPMMLAM